MWRRAVNGSGGDNTVKVFRGKPDSTSVLCGFQPTRVCLSDTNYNTSHKLIREWDYAIEATKYVQRYDDTVAIINNSDAPFIISTSSTGFELNPSLYALLSNNVVIMASE